MARVRKSSQFRELGMINLVVSGWKVYFFANYLIMWYLRKYFSHNIRTSINFWLFEYSVVPTSPDPMEEAWNWYSLQLKQGFLTFSIVLVGARISVICISIVFPLYWKWSEKITLEFRAFSTMFNYILFPFLFQPFFIQQVKLKIMEN